jgi:serine/threonine-protein kinase
VDDEAATRAAPPKRRKGRVAEADVPPVGAIIAGRYRVDKVLGAGGMGCVVAAEHLALRERVAIKFVVPELAHSRDGMMRFLREARAASRIKCEHVVRVSDAGTHDDGRPYMVMECLEGCDLGKLIEGRGRFSIADAVDYTLQACVAVAEAHSLGIVHRDLKPANLFLTRRPDGTPLVKVLDFGISKAITGDGGELDLTATGDVFGSPKYMSPEQVRNSKNVDARTDVWAMAVVLYELLSGAVPFDADTAPGTLAKIVADPPVPLSSRRAEVPRALEAAMMRSLEKSPENRCKSIADFAVAIAPFGSRDAARLADSIKALGAPKRPSQVDYDALPPLAGATMTGPSEPTARPWTGQSQRSTKLGTTAALFGGGLVLAIVVAFGAVMTMRTRGGDTHSNATTALAPSPAPPPIESVVPTIASVPAIPSAVATDVSAVPTPSVASVVQKPAVSPAVSVVHRRRDERAGPPPNDVAPPPPPPPNPSTNDPTHGRKD